MTLLDMLQHRRAVRNYDAQRPLNPDTVRQCLAQAVLAPTSSNMQLWEAYHITQPHLLHALGKACLGQQTAMTAQQMVVFVVRQDHYKTHARFNLERATAALQAAPDFPQKAERLQRVQDYYGRIIPMLYARYGGFWGLLRSLTTSLTGLFRPIYREVSEGDMRVVAHKSCALAAQTFMLAMSEAGCDTCPVEGFDSRLLKRALQLPRGAEINMLVTCGYRAADGVWGERLRLPFSQFYHLR